VRLSFDAVATATDYESYRDVASPATTLRGTPDAGISYDAVTPGTLYFYRVRAHNGEGYSPYSNEVSVFAEDYTAADPTPTNALLHARVRLG
jgi:hypothetical protein